jgi:hypothetical protein
MDARSDRTIEPAPPLSPGVPLAFCTICQRGRVGLHATRWAANHASHLAGDHRIQRVDLVLDELARLGYPTREEVRP